MKTLTIALLPFWLLVFRILIFVRPSPIHAGRRPLSVKGRSVVRSSEGQRRESISSCDVDEFAVPGILLR